MSPLLLPKMSIFTHIFPILKNNGKYQLYLPDVLESPHVDALSDCTWELYARQTGSMSGLFS